MSLPLPGTRCLLTPVPALMAPSIPACSCILSLTWQSQSAQASAPGADALELGARRKWTEARR